MTKLTKKIFAALSASTMFLSIATPAMAETSIVVTGNGANSDNTVEVEVNKNTTVTQNNNAIVTNSITTNSSTGGNDANQNTGGDVLVKTGDAKAQTTIENMLNSNKASVDCCKAADLSVEVSGNGANSDNKVEVEGAKHYRKDTGTSIFQDNTAYVTNSVSSDASTGKNDANQNTGGDVAVATGDATSKVAVSTTANANWAKVGGEGNTADVSAVITGNGYNTDNKVELELANDIILVQDNLANVVNAVSADAKTGHNDANQNAGGDVLVATGDAKSDVTVDNMVNFNWADVDCGCIEDLFAKIAGNGTDSDNKIEFEASNDLGVFQGGNGAGNNALLTNGIGADAKTGKNDANQNGGGSNGDPAVLTGDATTTVAVDNSGNTNSYGVAAPELPWDFDFHFSLDLDLSHLLALLH